ncbi:hypothetical protein ASF30_12660 [Leifsonia sp. Leaf264]|nr:hypothetical protein ASF30_12660 [Leifsonia sp. Leaf264]
MSTIPVQFKRLHPDAVLPTAATPGDAGFDLRSTGHYFIEPGEHALVKTGFAQEIPSDTVGLVCSRSGLALKHSVAVLNAPGVIDSGYRGEIMVILHNFGDTVFVVTPGDRVAQMMYQHYLTPDFTEVDGELSDSVRGVGGGGSTGTNEVIVSGKTASL